MRVLVGGVGYRDLGDQSFGPGVSDRLAERDWPPGVDVEVDDLSFNPIALVQRLEAEPAERRFNRVVLVSAIARAGRPAGTVEAYRWDGALPSPGRIQAAVAEAVTGVISLDNTLIVGRQFGGLPDEVLVVEIEPENESFGDRLSGVVQAQAAAVDDLVMRLATDPGAPAHVPLAPLGGGRLSAALS